MGFYDKIPWQKQPRDSRLHFMMEGQSRPQELEAASHTHSKEPRKDANIHAFYHTQILHSYTAQDPYAAVIQSTVGLALSRQ